MHLRKYLSLLSILSLILLLVSGCTHNVPHTNHYEKASTNTSSTDTTPNILPTNTLLSPQDTLPSITDTPSSYRSWPSTSSSTTKITPIPTAPSLPRADVLLDVQAIPQYPDYPTGCESVSAVMALQYAGIQITVDDFIDNHLVCDNYNFYWMDDVLHGPDPYSVFIGDPRSQSSYGLYGSRHRKRPTLLRWQQEKDYQHHRSITFRSMRHLH